MTIGEKIRRLRKEHNMTMSSLGEHIGVQKSAINKYENNTVINLKKETINKIAKIFNVNISWLLDDNQEWPPMLHTYEDKEIIKLYLSLSPKNKLIIKNYIHYLKSLDC